PGYIGACRLRRLHLHRLVPARFGHAGHGPWLLRPSWQQMPERGLSKWKFRLYGTGEWRLECATPGQWLGKLFRYRPPIMCQVLLLQMGPGGRRGQFCVRAGRWLLPDDRKSTRLNSSHVSISYAVFCLKKKNKI